MGFTQTMQRIRVPAGFLLAPIMLVLARPTWNSILYGALVGGAGLVVRGWASGYLRKNERLTTGGPYQFTRNPLYFGTLLLGLGLSICSGSAVFTLLFALLYLLVYVPVMQAEADTMRSLFERDYEPYSRSVPLFFPWRGSSAAWQAESGRIESESGAESAFDFTLYMKHREYRATLGFLAAVGVLACMVLLRK